MGTPFWKTNLVLSYCIYRSKLDKSAVIDFITMAAKRVTATAINWAEFATKIPAANKASFGALKNKQDGYVRAVNQLPEALPAIDFSSYKGKVAQAMVDDFEKKYKALEIPYPKDTVQAELAAEEAMIAVPDLVPQHRLDGKKNFWPFDRDFEEWKKGLDQVRLEYNEEHSMDPDAKGH